MFIMAADVHYNRQKIEKKCDLEMSLTVTAEVVRNEQEDHGKDESTAIGLLVNCSDRYMQIKIFLSKMFFSLRCLRVN